MWYIQFWDQGNKKATISIPEILTVGQKYHIKAVINLDECILYVDGGEKLRLSYAAGVVEAPIMLGVLRSHTHFDNVLVLGPLYQCNLQTKEHEMPAGNYMITVSGDDYSFSYPFVLFEGGKAKGKP